MRFPLFRKLRLFGTVRWVIARGDEARDRRDWSAASLHYARALRRNPSLAHIWVQLGHARKEIGDLRYSEACYLTAIEMQPRWADTFLQLGHLLKIAGRTKEAKEAYGQALELDPDCRDAAAELARLPKVA
jgi:tetratricopeptide (TPR) repeat protein